MCIAAIASYTNVEKIQCNLVEKYVHFGGCMMCILVEIRCAFWWKYDVHFGAFGWKYDVHFDHGRLFFTRGKSWPQLDFIAGISHRTQKNYCSHLGPLCTTELSPGYLGLEPKNGQE